MYMHIHVYIYSHNIHAYLTKENKLKKVSLSTPQFTNDLRKVI